LAWFYAKIQGMQHVLKILLTACFASSVLAAGGFAHAQTWAQMGANTNYFWAGIVSSANGKKLIATDYEGSGEGIYLSTNSGATWTFSCPLNFAGRTVCSADGTKMAVEAWNGVMSIYTSTNSGQTWSQAGAPPMGGWNNNIRSMIGSADGSELFVFYADGTDNSGVYGSTNWGVTWSTVATLNEPWTSTTCTGDGTKLAVATSDSNAQILVSTNTGISWRPAAPMPSPSASILLSTADGSKLIAANSAGLFISTDWGISWSETNAATGGEIVSSADASLLLGMRLNTLNGNYDICTSTNLGASWISNSLPEAPWAWVACSADGNELIANGTNGIWISKTAPSPQLDLAPANNRLFFSWIVPSTNMVLQESPDLNTWTTLTNCPALNSATLQEQLTLSKGSNNGFFRLISR
jgi:hypothetical protein